LHPAAHYARAGRGVTALWLKYRDRDGAASGNTTSLYCRAVKRHNGLIVNKLNIVDIWKK